MTSANPECLNNGTKNTPSNNQLAQDKITSESNHQPKHKENLVTPVVKFEIQNQNSDQFEEKDNKSGTSKFEEIKEPTKQTAPGKQNRESKGTSAKENPSIESNSTKNSEIISNPTNSKNEGDKPVYSSLNTQKEALSTGKDKVVSAIKPENKEKKRFGDKYKPSHNSQKANEEVKAVPAEIHNEEKAEIVQTHQTQSSNNEPQPHVDSDNRKTESNTQTRVQPKEVLLNNEKDKRSSVDEADAEDQNLEQNANSESPEIAFLKMHSDSMSDSEKSIDDVEPTSIQVEKELQSQVDQFKEESKDNQPLGDQ